MSNLRGKRLIGYVRVSKAREEMISPEQQADSIMRASRADGFTLVGLPDPVTGKVSQFIEDLDESGRDFAKRKIAWLIKQVKDGHADGVAVWQVARWGRNLEASLTHHRELVEAGGVLASATEPIGEADTPFGRFALSQLMLIAQLQSDQIQAGWIQALDRRRNLGQATARKRFGYDWDKSAGPFLDLSPIDRPTPVGFHVPMWEPNDEWAVAQAEWLRRLYLERVDGATTHSLMRLLNNSGVLSSMKAPFTNTSLNSMLDTGFGAGFLAVGVVNGRPSEYWPAGHEPLIDIDTWRLYLKMRGLPGPPLPRASKIPPRHLRPVARLSGLVLCAGCQQLTTRNQDRGIPQWTCRSLAGVTHKPCVKKASRYERLVEADVLKWLILKHAEAATKAEERLAASHQEEKSDAARTEELIKTCDAQEAKLTRRMNGYATQVADQDLTRDEAAPLLAKARAEREEIRTRRAELRTAEARHEQEMPPPDVFAALVDLMRDPTIPADDANRVLRKVIRRVWLYPQVGGRTHGERRIDVEPLWEPDRRSAAA